MIIVSVVATTDRMDLDEPTTTIIPAAPPAAKDQPLPVPVPAAVGATSIVAAYSHSEIFVIAYVFMHAIDDDSCDD